MGKQIKKKTSLTKIVVKTIVRCGMGMILFTGAVLFFLSMNASYNLLPAIGYQRIEFIMFLFYIVGMFGLLFMFSYLAARQLQKRGKILLETTEKIKAQDLDFTVTESGIKEIDEVLKGMDDMKTALRESLESQWRLEENRRAQMSALAHDFKTPVTVMQGNLYLLEQEKKANPLYLEDMHTSLNQMQGYLEQLLEVTRAEQGYALKKTKVELNHVIIQVIDLCAPIAKKNQIELKFLPGNQKIYVCGDEMLLERAVQNLISNALDFTPEGGKIELDVCMANEQAVISVIDTGKGFPVEVLSHGTDQFFMADESRGRKNHYGLGLFIVKKIVEQHNGSMQLSNDEITGGARVQIELPVKNNKQHETL